MPNGESCNNGQTTGYATSPFLSWSIITKCLELIEFINTPVEFVAIYCCGTITIKLSNRVKLMPQSHLTNRRAMAKKCKISHSSVSISNFFPRHCYQVLRFTCQAHKMYNDITNNGHVPDN